MRKPLIAAALLLSATALAGRRAEPEGRTPPAGLVPPTTNFYVRAAFDTDPSIYLGRFVPDDLAVPDESSARKTACSQHIQVHQLDGGGVEYDDVFSASTAAALRLGIPQADLTVGGEVGAQTSLRAKYTLTRKWVADIGDPVAFASCCRRSPGECTGRFVGEFLEGAGSLWYSKGSDVSAKGLNALSKLGLQIEASHGVAWAQGRTFEKPVSFAFRLTEVPPVDCKQLVDNPPATDKGMYFGAVSSPQPNENLARSAAMGYAREQVVQWLGEQITTGQITNVQVQGGLALESGSQQVTRAAEGVARYVKDEMTCVETEPTPDGPVYIARTLAFVPASSFEEAAREAFKAAP